MCTVFVMCMSVFDVFESVPRCVYSVMTMFSSDCLVTGRRNTQNTLLSSLILFMFPLWACAHIHTHVHTHYPPPPPPPPTPPPPPPPCMHMHTQNMDAELFVAKEQEEMEESTTPYQVSRLLQEAFYKADKVRTTHIWNAQSQRDSWFFCPQESLRGQLVLLSPGESGSTPRQKDQLSHPLKLLLKLFRASPKGPLSMSSLQQLLLAVECCVHGCVV